MFARETTEPTLAPARRRETVLDLMPMKIFIDTANLAEIREAHSWGVIDGVTTNPSLIAKEGRDFIATIHEICELVDGPVSAEVIAQDAPKMVQEGRLLAQVHKNVVVKIPRRSRGSRPARSSPKRASAPT